ncbi:YkgJ family cysteine cluster protein [Desulfobacterium sp. N47]|uniref:YkgJ family cysteine cluster protein n=1 Tax=Desulfobacterium sp. N47 TaxID=3115210 RepID=UPI003CBECC77
MDTDNNMASIDPVKYNLDSEFKFRCHSGLSCFTKCCRGITIILTPYDIIRLKEILSLSSEEFLAIYTEPQLLEKTDLPIVTLKLLDDEQKSCPFVRDDGCLVYTHRPTACRYYPAGVASLNFKEDSDDQGFYFFVNEPHCLGFEEDKIWTIREWRIDQGVDIHDQINAGWMDLVVKKRSFPKNIMLTEKSKNMFFTACYDVDKFRRFIFESSFLTRYKVDNETVEKIKKDDIALLEFAFGWLDTILFKNEQFKVSE